MSRRLITTAATTLAMAVTVTPAALSQEPPPATTVPGATDRADEFLQLAREEAAAYTIRMEGDKHTTVQLERDPLLRWSNPVVGEIYGGVFLWTREGRPHFAAAIYKWYSPFTHRGTELVSLSPQPFALVRDGQEVWGPEDAGVEFAPIPDAPPPAQSATARARQMRELARQFTAEETDRDGNHRELRLLTQPVYRYGSADSEVVDGAMYVFVLGTDPEVLLLIEARRGGAGSEWQRAFARMNSVELRVQRGDGVEWSTQTLPWSEVNDRSRPYTAIRRD